MHNIIFHGCLNREGFSIHVFLSGITNAIRDRIQVLFGHILEPMDSICGLAAMSSHCSHACIIIIF